MPKRPCEFDDDLAPQMKVHVGEKEIDNGVQREVQMKKVYDKTLGLLMAGAKELSRKMNESIDLNSTNTMPATKTMPEVKPNLQQNLKQMFLNNKLELEIKGEYIKDVPIDICGCCKIIDDHESHNCYYCDKILCSTCLVQCEKCTEHFCQSCSVVVYDNREYNVCLNCYG